MKIFQIIIGEVPEVLEEYICSIRLFCHQNKIEYRVISEVSEQYKNIEDMRIVSNFMRVDELTKDPENCYFDWDVSINYKFKLNDTTHPQFNSMGDNIMYSGNIEFWKDIRKLMGNPEDHRYELGIIFNRLLSINKKITKEMIIPNVGWSHLYYSGKKWQ